MAWTPTAPLEVFAEALSVPAMIHTPVRETRVLTVGTYALPLAKLALRYPDTVEVCMADLHGAQTPRDKRVTALPSLDALPSQWAADVIGIAVPGDPKDVIKQVAPRLKPDGVLVVAMDVPSRAREIKDHLRETWSHVLPYREHAPDLVLFLIASDRVLGRPLRPIPPRLARINPRHLSSMFAFPSDEYRLLFGQESA